MIISIISALVFAKLKHYQLKPLLKTYALYPFFAMELIYWLLQIAVFTGNFSYIKYQPYVKNAYLYLLFIPIIVYKLYGPALAGSASVFIGTVLNRLAMHVNGGTMPVFATLSKYTGYYNEAALQNDKIHSVGTAATRLKLLCDYIDVGWSILSIGDVFIHAFTVIIIYSTIKAINPAVSGKK